MNEDEHLALARRFGDIALYPILELLGIDRPLETIEDSETSPPGADDWHTDVTWIERPPQVAILAALAIPEFGGDTLWANMHDAFEALSPKFREVLDGLTVQHGLGPEFFARVSEKGGEELANRVRDAFSAEVEHPLIRTHPETGRKSLFISPHFMKRIVGMEPEESDLLLDFLSQHAQQPQFQCRWRWREGDVAIWDERCTLHRALADHFPRHRKIRRCTVVGDRPN